MARLETIGKKKSVSNQPLPVKPPRLAYTISEFAEAHGFSPSMYYKLKRQGLMPREMKVGTRTLITVNAALRWQTKRQAAAVKAKSMPISRESTEPPPQPTPAKARAKAKPTRGSRRAEEANA